GSSEDHYEKIPFDIVDWDDPEERRRNVEDELIELVEQLPEDATIFDVGCGPGRIAIPFLDQGRQVVPIDLTREALDHVAHFCDVPLIRGSALNLPVQDGVADLAISTGVLHHTPDPRQGIAENCRILKPGGRLYLRLFNRDGYYKYMYCWLGGAMRALRRTGKPGRLLVDGGMFQVYRRLRGLKSGDRVPTEKVRGVFVNYFLKDMVQLMSRQEVESCLATANMHIDSYAVKGTMHCYVATREDG
ncbi:MAG: class I SAM-dependent methyltransferase, partial [Candidatus Latescibacteria bacterium]|nr:class I SAM-dependent methyltransferase [Candidatus Latescibacterota bacterium]